jgi:hypothetical protein
MSLIPELEAELEATIRRRPEARPARRRALRSSRRFAPILALGGLAATTAALAAGGVIGLGSPVNDPGVGVRRADVGLGTVVPGTARLLGLRVADPDDGPPWGMRVVSTTRGMGCLQVGRVVDGRLGVLGRDGVFGDDGRFHPLPSAVVNPTGCGQLDAGGRLFTNGVVGSIPAAGTTDGACFDAVSGMPAARRCPEREERRLFFGTLGPEAESVSYRAADGTEKTVPTAAPFGAYLIVDRPDPAHRFSGTSGGGLQPGNTSITELRFSGGRSCQVTERGFAAGDGSCPLPGYRPRPVARVTEDEVKAPVHARVVRSGKHTAVVVSFRARVAVTDAGSAYSITRRTPGEPGTLASGTTGRNIAAGEIVTYRFPYQHRHGTYTGRVAFQPDTHGFAFGGAGGLLVGRWAVTLR